MAEVVVNYVLGKITEAVYQEALNQYGVGDKVEWAKRELEWVSAYLEDADAKQNKNARVKQWVKDVKEVAYMIEDALDKFFVEMGGGAMQKGILRRAGHLLKALIARRKVSTEIGNIKQRLLEIKENRDNFGIISLESSSQGSAKKPARPVVVPEIDKTEVVGFEDDIKNICEQLLDQSVSRCSVVSIVGPGGRGKTTLATKIYRSAEVKRHFDCRIWVTISQEFKFIDVLMKMLEKMQVNAREVGDEEYFTTELHKSLNNKRYLIVLDDVWSSDVLTQLEVALPENHNGSRVLITTRFIGVAKESDAANKPYELRTLNEDESQKLLLKKAFPNQPANKCPDNLLPLINQFSQKCGGWPLALVVLGGILSTKYPDYNTWNELMLKMDWQIEGSKYLDIISTSYEHLPIHLKPCFMYIASFPKDYQINATTLIQLWIAEGFVRQDSQKTLEDTAENYLEELVQRCMVQVSRRSWSGRIKYCYVHDILHELAIHKAQEDNFLLVCSKSNANSIFGTSASTRRLTFHKFGYRDQLPIELVGPNLRTLISFGGDVPDNNYHLLNNEPRMVRVLHVKNFGYRDTKWLKHQTTLRYFQFYVERLYELPTSFWNNKMLRYVKINGSGNYNYVKGPPSSVNLENLVTLSGVDAMKEWIAKFPNIPRIRKLGIYVDPDIIDWEALTDSMSRLEHLNSLVVAISYLVFDFYKPLRQRCLTPAFKNYKQVHSLKLLCRWPEKVVSDLSLFPPHLAKLTLAYSCLKQDPMPELEKLPNLRVLRLLYRSYEGKRLVCSSGGFECLQQLILESLFDLEELEVEEGAMPMLNLLDITSCSELKMLPDLQYWTNLRELNLSRMPKEFYSRLKEADQHKVKHIISIIYHS